MNGQGQDHPNEIAITDWVIGARLGDKDSLAQLSEAAQPRLLAYIYRLTLNYDLSQDLTQQVLMKMLQGLWALDRADRFCAWLFRTALGEVQHYFRDRKRDHMVQMSALAGGRLEKYVHQDLGDGLTWTSRMELSNIVLEAVMQMSLLYRNILVLRCYDQLSYAQIAEVMGCKEVRARVLFYRATRALKRHLTQNGYSKEALLTGLGLFGVLTLPTQGTCATSAGISASILDVGPLAASIAALGTKGGMAVSASVSAILVAYTTDQLAVAAVVVVVVSLSFVAGLFMETLT